jgi:flagellar transcriptional activator FlhC
LSKVSELECIDAVMKAYRLYSEQIATCGMEPILSITRAWRLVKFVDNNMLSMTKCSKCGGHFVSEAYENSRHFVCGLCEPPARAGKSAVVGGILLH